MRDKMTGGTSRREVREDAAFRRGRAGQQIGRATWRLGVVLGLVAVGAGALTGAYSALDSLGGERRVELARASAGSGEGSLGTRSPSPTASVTSTRAGGTTRPTPTYPSTTTAGVSIPPTSLPTATLPTATTSAHGSRSPGRPPGPKPTRWTGVRAGQESFTDLPYDTASRAQVMDLYLPVRTGAPVPVVVLVHGGAFLAGDKRDRANLVEPLLAKGFAVANLNYRLSGEALFPAGAQDVKTAVRWLRTNAARYGLDGARFGAWGDSAGGYMVVMLGVTGDQRSVFDPAPSGPGSPSSAVQAVVDWYGPVDFATMDAQAAANGCGANALQHSPAGSPESLWLGAPLAQVPTKVEQANLVRYLATARRLPQFLVVHGGSDCIVAPGQSRELVGALKARGVPATLKILDGAGHADRAFDAEIDDATAFLTSALR